MRPQRTAPLVVLYLAALCAHLTLPPAVFSQAWVPEKGEGSVSITYQSLVAHDHLDFTGTRNSHRGTVRSRTTVFEI